MKIGFFHHGACPSEDVAVKLAAMRVAISGRNATQFSASDGERFDEVLVDDGGNTAAIREFYEAQGVPVYPIQEFLNGEIPAATPGAAEQPNLDAKPQPKQAGRNQGATTKQPKAPKQPKAAKVEAPAAEPTAPAAAEASTAPAGE